MKWRRGAWHRAAISEAEILHLPLVVTCGDAFDEVPRTGELTECRRLTTVPQSIPEVTSGTMRQGGFPGQEQVFRHYARLGLEAESGFRRTRRRFFGLAFGAAAVAGSCGWLAGRTGPVVPETTHTPLEEIALGPLDRLEACALDLLAEIEQGRGTPTLWRGFERLALWSTARADRSILRQRLVATLRVATAPGDVQTVLQQIDLR